MTKQSFSIEDKITVTKIMFTDASITTDVLAKKAGIHIRTIGLWKEKVLKGIPGYLQAEFGDEENISSEDRAEVTSDYLRYDCDMDELVEEYGIDAELIIMWSKSVLDNLGGFFISKRKSGSSPIKGKRPNRSKQKYVGSVSDRLNDIGGEESEAA